VISFFLVRFSFFFRAKKRKKNEQKKKPLRTKNGTKLRLRYFPAFQNDAFFILLLIPIIKIMFSMCGHDYIISNKDFTKQTFLYYN